MSRNRDPHEKAGPQSVLVLPVRIKGGSTAPDYPARCFRFKDEKEAGEAMRWLQDNNIAVTRTNPDAARRMANEGQ